MTDFEARLEAATEAALADLVDLIAIPSISSKPEHADDVARTAALIAERVREIGCDDVEVVTEGGKPAVIARFPGPEGTPTVCLYAHHDVQPTGDVDAWTNSPFEATERDGRLYARGSADDKGGVALHLGVLRAFDGKPPVGVTLFIEGEEEVGSPSLVTIIEKHRDKLESDVFVIADATNWEVGTPALTTTLRGTAGCIVEVSTLKHGVHSGEYGGVVPDALMALCRLIATLHDDEGNVAVEGLGSRPAADIDYPLDRLREETGILDGVEFIGSGSVVERIWTKPSISVIALDTTRIADASNTLIPTASARISLRVAPGDDAQTAIAALVKHLETHAPWGAQVKVRGWGNGQPCIIPDEGPVVEAARASLREAWGVEPATMGCGGSIPMINEFQKSFPNATVLVTAVTDPSSRMHGIDESLHLGDWRNAIRAEALLLTKLAEG